MSGAHECQGDFGVGNDKNTCVSKSLNGADVWKALATAQGNDDDDGDGDGDGDGDDVDVDVYVDVDNEILMIMHMHSTLLNPSD